MKSPQAIRKAVAGRVFSFPSTLPVLSLYKIQNRNVLTNQPTLGTEKPVINQVVKQFPSCYGTLRFIRAHDFRLPSQSRWDLLSSGILCHIRSQSKKKPNIWNSAKVSRRRMLVMVALCSGDFKLYFHTSHITPLQLVIELRGLEWTCV